MTASAALKTTDSQPLVTEPIKELAIIQGEPPSTKALFRLHTLGDDTVHNVDDLISASKACLYMGRLQLDGRIMDVGSGVMVTALVNALHKGGPMEEDLEVQISEGDDYAESASSRRRVRVWSCCCARDQG